MRRRWIFDSEWVVLSRDGQFTQALGALEENGAYSWKPVSPAKGRLWTDDFSPIWRAYTGP